MKKFFALIALAAAFAGPVWAAPQTVTLSVPGMTCSACPIMVKTSLKKVPGVTNADVSFQKLEAVVSFDDTKTDVQTIAKATADVGYPSTVKK